MANLENSDYIAVTDSQGTGYVCPSTFQTADRTVPVDISGECVEKDVTERYSGNLA